MDLATALQSSYAEGMGCRAVGSTDDCVLYLRRDGRGQFVAWMASPASKAILQPWDQPGLPCLLSALTAPYELCDLPPHVEPDFRPCTLVATRISDLLDRP